MAITKAPTYGKLPGYIKSVQAYAKSPTAQKQTKLALSGALPPTSSTLAAPRTQVPILNVPAATTPSADLRPSAARLAQPANYTPTLDEVLADPVYQSALNVFNTQQASNRRDLSSLINRLVTQGGYDIRGALQGDPTLAGYAGDITDATAAAAAQNPLSDAAQITQAYNRGLENLAYAQAARGTLGSGAQATGATSLLEQSQVANNQRMNALLDAIRSGVGNYTSAQLQGQTGLQQTMADVAARLSQVPGAAYDIGTETTDTGAPDVTGASGVTSAAPPPNGVVWGGQTFTNRTALSRYLAARGVSYATWAANHPSAAARLR